MNSHADNWIDAYLDGELSPNRRQQIDTHLENCWECQVLLKELRTLSNILQEAPPATSLKPKDQFIVDIRSQLEPRGQLHQTQLPAMRSGWYLIPIAVLFALGFIHSIFLLSSLVSLFPGAQDILTEQISFGLTLFMLPDPWNSIINLVGGYNLINWNSLTGLLALAALSLVYLSWIAGWWLRSRHGQHIKIGVNI